MRECAVKRDGVLARVDLEALGVQGNSLLVLAGLEGVVALFVEKSRMYSCSVSHLAIDNVVRRRSEDVLTASLRLFAVFDMVDWSQNALEVCSSGYIAGT